jgi:Cof subfamily protein (haloacid dehalogenase superfamily)
MSVSGEQRWLIALDIDGTLVHDDGYLSPRVAAEVKRVQDLGHLVVVATGRSAVNAIGVTKEIGLLDGKLIASNGAVTVKIKPEHPKGFETEEVITFDPTDVLTKLIAHLPDAHFAVEDADGVYKYHKHFPADALGDVNHETPLDQLMHQPVSRIVVLSPEQETEEFVDTVATLGLSSVSYAIGYSAWLDIAPLGVTKASALEAVRAHNNIRPDQIITVGDGRNDISMFEWAKAGGGLAFAMGQGPDEVHAAASFVTDAVEDDGVASVLSGFEGILFTRSVG